MEARVEIGILGTLEVLVDGIPAALGGHQRAAILAVLLLHHGDVLSADQLIDQVWAGRPPRSATNTLHAHVSRLRRTLGGTALLQSHGPGYRLVIDPERVDAHRFESLVTRGRDELAKQDWSEAVTVLDSALALWRGPALADFGADPWAQFDAIRLEELRYAAEEGRTDAELALGRHAEVLPRLEQRVARHPLRERSAAQLMTALYRCGRQGEALNVYERVRRVLADELGVDPAPTLQALHQAVLTHDPSLTAPAHTQGAAPSRSARPSAPRRVSNLPARNRVFSGREDLLAELGRALASSRAVALYGLAGVGKTQAAVEYAHRNAADYDVTWRASAAEPLALAGAMEDLALRLGVRERADRGELVTALRDRLAGMGRWLIVLDDVEDASLLERLLPDGGEGHVIITSRNPAWGLHAVPLRIDPFSREESVAFLERRLGLPGRSSGAPELADQLGDLPFALEQAAAYSEQTGMTFEEYADLFRRRADKLLSRAGERDQTFSTAWQLAFERVRAASASATELLYLCACLGGDGLSLRLLRGLAGVLPPALEAAVADEVGLQDAIAHLLRHSLVDRDRGRLRMHKMVSVAAMATLSREGRQEWLLRGVHLVEATAPADPENPTNWPHWDEVLPGLIHLAGQSDNLDTVPPALPQLLCGAGRYLTTRAAFDRAAWLFETSLTLLRRAGGSDSDLAAVLTEQGKLLEVVGDLEGARTAQEQALTLAEGAFGPEHPGVAYVLKRLGDVLVCQRRLPEARQTLERGHGILAARDDADGRELARIGRDLGFAAWLAGDLAAAQQWLTRSLTASRSLLDPGHPDVAHALSGLGLVLQDAGRAEEAIKLQEQALALLAGVYGEEHPEVAHTLDKLGYALRLVGRFDEARMSHERALAILEACYGPVHGEVGMPLTNLGLVYQDIGDHDMAQAHQERAMSVFSSVFGPDHPHAQLGARRLGVARLLGGRVVEARELLERAVSGTERALGPGHPDVGRALLDLAAVHEHLDDLAAAAECRTRAERILSAAYGPDALQSGGGSPSLPAGSG
ncbi:FxSxx-COOH system tetratricopeptide repeat protein [Nonomuraea sp. bgisy101]|uniref:FxSxx-COOH system tetratricopeptide repeat protein n=1 Tax=Nonomuraea sp. bgisy101 TaxID=3413784 RepID=UPI003D75C765